ncbi:MAG: hypothetical protein IJO77_06390, partial [Oscillospiraceae bacterium]|nr:hypothetical protein [Oscillospiraceae bacterium]
TPRYAPKRDYSARKPEKKPISIPKPAEQKTEILFAVGDKVKHKAFGVGTVLKMQPTGSDALMEVEFETAGVKRLMMKSASAFMTKI